MLIKKLPSKLDRQYLFLLLAYQSMKKLFLICLLVILPLQFSYAAVSCHCSNEQPVNSQKNQITTSNSDIGDKNEPTSSSAHGRGCLGHCHLFGTVFFQTYSSPLALAEASSIVINNEAFYQSPISNGLERPNWLLAV